jgi:tetratricopeptide (TPR) repeat protein
MPSVQATDTGGLSRLRPLGVVLLASVAVSFCSGCATASLDRARDRYRHGQLEQAELAIGRIDESGHNALLEFLERGTIRQSRGDYPGSTDDFLQAADVAERLDYLSLSQSAASFVVNDTVQAYRGVPYERMLLHAFAAANYLQMGKVDDAAVEARRMIAMTANLDGFPDIAYCRYLAGLCLELQGDFEGARFQYRQVNMLFPNARVDEATGRIRAAPGASIGDARQSAARNSSRELVCFVGTGSLSTRFSGASQWRMADAVSVDVFVNGTPAGGTISLTDMRAVLTMTNARLAAMRAAKTTTRVGLKYTVAALASRDETGLASLIAFLLFVLETPDTRQWETLPQQLHVARVSCPDKVESVRLVFRSSNGGVLGDRTLPSPITLNGNTYVAICREL